MPILRNSIKSKKILDELINNTMDLPRESQELLLMIAKGMKYTRDYMLYSSEENKKSTVYA